MYEQDCPFIFENTTVNDDNYMPIAKKNDDGSIDFNLGYFMSDDAVVIDDTPKDIVPAEEKKPKRRKKALSEDEVNRYSQDTQIQDNTQVPYSKSYEETNAVLKTAIAQSDQLLSEVKEDIDNIRSSKTLKSKYTYITNLTASAATLINTRITAAREINSSITQAHNLELKRAKDIKDMKDSEKNNDARMMDLYNAFINSPVGMYENNLNMPTIPNMMLGANDPANSIGEVSMNRGIEHEENLTPEQVRMRMENNPNIEEIVKYEPSSGRKWFEVINKMTNEPVPNYPTSDTFLLEDMSIDTRAGLARNRNLDKVWNVITVGNLEEY